MDWEDEPRVIKDEKPLLEAFVPEHLVHREGQKQAVADCLKPALSGRKPVNAFLHGPCGTGKTLLTKWLFDELKSRSSKASTVYVNCWKNRTPHSFLTETLKQLRVFTTYRQATDELLSQIEKEASEKPLLVCLDEVDALEDKNVLYDLSRQGVGLVLISNDPYALIDLDLRIKSSLQPEGIEFPAYSASEVKDILEQRKPYAFVPGAVSESVLKTTARLCDGDARIALETLRRAALLAEERGQEAVSVDHVKESFKTTSQYRKTEALKRLNEHERLLYLVLDENKKLHTKKLFSLYSKKVEDPATPRTYRNYMNKLTRLGLVRASGELTGRTYEAVG
jgi:orc1/cdc6 family replication initiation protein